MRKPNLDLKQAKLLVETERLNAQESQYNTLNTKVKAVFDRLTKKRALVQSLQAEINAESQDDTVVIPDPVS
jgi:hypothetical protein